MVAHSDGRSVLSTGPTFFDGSASTQESRAELFVWANFDIRSPLAFVAGWVNHRKNKVVAAPMPISPPSSMIVRTPAQRQRLQLVKPGLYFMTLSALLGSIVYESAATAFARTASFVQVVPLSSNAASLVTAVMSNAALTQFGALTPRDLTTSSVHDQCTPTSLPALTAQSLAAERTLRQALMTFSNPSDPAEQHYIREWAGAINSFDPSAFPSAACDRLPTLQQQALTDVPFAYPTPIVVTAWRDRKLPQRCSHCPGVTHCSQLIENSSRCAGRIQDWWARATHDFQLLAENKPFFPRLTKTIALGQDCFIPCARGCIWDCRTFGQVVPLDYHQPIPNVPLSLDRQALVDAMLDWPDQELRSHMAFGARFGASLPLQLVLTPQLFSLADAFDRTQFELKQLVDRGWYALFDYLPFVPLRMHPKGATERKLENRPRPTTDGSHPHASMPIYDTEDVPVLSINSAIRSGIYDPEIPLAVAQVFQPHMPLWWKAFATWEHVQSRIPKEYKPTLASVARDSAILAFPARCHALYRQPVFTFVDDFSNYFSQVPVAPEDYWKTVVAGFSLPHLEPLGEPRIQFVAEYRLGFGIAINSNICQRLANFIVHVFLSEFRQAEEQYLANEPLCVRQWVARRRSLSQQTGRFEDTLFRVHIYTDDPIFIVVGAERTVRALRLWRAITTRFKLLMAVPQKRRIGTMVKWLGFLPCPMHGIIVAERNKLLRAMVAVQQALAGQLTVDKYRSLLGFLEHLKVLLDKPRVRMYGLYRPLRRGHEIDGGPAALVRVDAFMSYSLKHWLTALASTAAAPVTYALPRARRKPLFNATFFVSSDAAKDGTPTPAIAGYAHGVYWQHFYSAQWLWLPIAVLEFLALAVSIIMFAPLLDQAPHVILQTDSLTAAFVLANDAARSSLIVTAHTLLLDTLEYSRLVAGFPSWRLVQVTHTSGDANVAADHLSRGNMLMFTTFCANLGVRPHYLPLSAAALAYLQDFFQRVDPLIPLEMYGLGRDPASTDYDGPFHQPRLHCTSRWSDHSTGQHSTAHLTLTFPSSSSLGQPGSQPPSSKSSSRVSSVSAPTSPSRPSSERFGHTQPTLPAPASGLRSPLAPAPVRPPPGPAPIRVLGPEPTLPPHTLPNHLPPPQAASPSSHQLLPRLTPLPCPDIPSAYRLSPPSQVVDPNEFRVRRDAVLRAGVPASTLASERASWAKWVAHCQLWGTEPLRDYLPAYSLAPDAAQAREDLLTLASSFIESCYLSMRPRRKGTVPKPMSAFKNWADIARIHQRLGLPRLDTSLLTRYVKGLTIQYRDTHGFDALLERRKEPISDPEHHHLMHLPAGAKLGPFTYHPNTRFALTWRALLAVLNHSGFRKAEWAVRARTDSTRMTFSRLVWQLDGTPHRDTLTAVQRALIRQRTMRAVALLYPVPSKCDPDGTAFCNKAIPFPVDVDSTLSAGTLLLNLEECVSPVDRLSTPLFADDTGVPFLGADMDKALRDALSLLNPASAATKSWHSYRIRLASKLRAALTPTGAPKYSDAVIQALLRWKTPASIAIYARYDTDTYAQILQSVDALDITSVQYANLPELTEQDRLDSLAATADNHLVPLLSQLDQDAAQPSVPARSPAHSSASQSAPRPSPASRQPRAVRPRLLSLQPSAAPVPQLTLDDARSSSSSVSGSDAPAPPHYFERPSSRRPPVPRQQNYSVRYRRRRLPPAASSSGS